MSDTKVTYWLRDDGQIETYHEASDANGVYAFTGSPPENKKSILDSEAITKIFRKRVQDDEKHWAERQQAGKVAAESRAIARKEKVEALVAAGLTSEAAELVVPPTRPFTESVYRPPMDAADNLRLYGLNDEQIQRVTGGWV